MRKKKIYIVAGLFICFLLVGFFSYIFVDRVINARLELVSTYQFDGVVFCDIKYIGLNEVDIKLCHLSDFGRNSNVSFICVNDGEVFSVWTSNTSWIEMQLGQDIYHIHYSNDSQLNRYSLYFS